MIKKLKDHLLNETKEICDYNDNDDDNETENSPYGLPCGFIPVKGFAKFFGLVSYFARSDVKLYKIWRHMYKFHFSKLWNMNPKSTENIIGKKLFF